MAARKKGTAKKTTAKKTAREASRPLPPERATQEAAKADDVAEDATTNVVE